MINIYLNIVISILLAAFYFKKIKYDFFSIRGVTVTYFVIFYPLVIIFIILDRWYFYDGVIINSNVILQSLYGYHILIFILFIAEFFRLKKHQSNLKIYNLNVNTNRVYLLILFFILALVLRFALGIYYHVSINPGYNLAAGAFQNISDKLHWIGVVTIFILLYKHYQTRKRKYLILSLLISILFVVVYLPSGSRTTAFSFVPIYMIYIVSNINSKKKILLFVITSAILLSMLIIFSGKMRVDESNFRDTGVKEDISLLTHRLSDCLNTGRVIEKVPSEYDYRYLENIDSLLFTPFPYFMRVMIGMKASFSDGPEYAYKIGLTPSWTSVPITILGDFYSRLGWFGIFFFSTLLAVVLILYDNILNKRSALFKIIFLALFSRYISQIYVVDLQVLFVSLTREFIVTYLLSLGILYFVKKKKVS